MIAQNKPRNHTIKTLTGLKQKVLPAKLWSTNYGPTPLPNPSSKTHARRGRLSNHAFIPKLAVLFLYWPAWHGGFGC